MEKVIVVIGPTSVGKTKMGVALAKKLNGEVISGDSMQAYRQMDIGTAKVTIEDGSETIDEDYVLFTYTDGFGDVPYEVDEFLQSQNEHLKGVVVSGDTGYGEAYCKAGDVIAEQYNVPCLYKVENDGSDEDIEAIKKVIA